MTDLEIKTYTSFDGYRRIASGPLEHVALAIKRACDGGTAGSILIFDDTTGRATDIDTRGTEEEVIARLATPAPQPGQSEAPSRQSAPGTPQTATHKPRGRGRPKLGVVAREVTLLPRHWEWLATQPGGASVALRRLVEEARRNHADKDKTRRAQERAYHFMSAMGGDLPGFEEAIRALFANDRDKFNDSMATWPDDVRDYANRLAFGDNPQSVTSRTSAEYTQ